MGRRQIFLLLLVLCVFASFVSAQSSSVEFLDEWGEATSRVLEQSRVLLRVIDPAADTSPGRDSVAVDLNSTIAMDTDFTSLMETGEATGVFEGEVDLTTDFYLNSLEDESHLLTYPRTYPPESLDTAIATYNGVSGSVEAAPSLTDLLDESGASPAGFALGETVRVRVRDQYANKNVGRETTAALLTLSGGDNEVLALVETGGDTGVFEVSLPSGEDAPVVGDGRIQGVPGQTISVIHTDPNGFSASEDSATVTATSVRLIDREGRPTDLYLEDAEAIVRVVNLAANLDPEAFETVTATVSMQLSGDVETLSLRETGGNTGVFEGAMAMSYGYPYSGNQRLDSQAITGPSAPFDTVTASYSGSSDSAGLTGSIVRLFDEKGQEEIGSLALSSFMLIRVEAFNDSGFIDTTAVEVRSLTTGDVETLQLRETGPASNVFEGKILVFWSTAPGPGDGSLGAVAGETLRVEHLNANGYTRSRAEATAVRSSVRFVDEAGRPVSVLLEGSTARIRVQDRMSQPTPPPAGVESFLGRDSEPLSLALVSGTTYLFEGSIPLGFGYYGTPGDGELATGRNTTPVNQPERVTATSNGAFAEAITAPAILEFVDGQGEPRPTEAAGALLRLRALAPLANQSPSNADYFMVQVRSACGGDVRSVYLNETGADTGIFEGTIGTRTWTFYDLDKLFVEPNDTVTALFNAFDASSEIGGAAATVAIVPMLVELVDGDGQPVLSYLFGETVHVRVTETAANADPATGEVVSATVQAWRRSDHQPDVEVVDLLETGVDTGVFSGSLPTALIDWQASPSFLNGSLELLDIYPPYGDLATVTATRGTTSDTALMEDSQVRFTTTLGEDTPILPAGHRVHVWLRRPAANTTFGIDSESVEIWTSDGSDSDFETLALAETGGDTGIFTGSIPVSMLWPTIDNGILEGDTGVVVEVDKRVTVTLRSVDTAMIGMILFFPPEAEDDFATTAEATPVTIDVIANDYDIDSDDLGVVAVTQGTQGTVSFTPAGATVTYTPNAGAIGSDSFTYTVSDFGGLVDGNTDTATVFVSISAFNRPPVAVDDSATTEEDTPWNVAVKANDSDPDGDPLTVASVTQGANGSAAIQAGGTVTYTPNPNFHGSDAFTYTVSDGQVFTDTATVSVTVNSVYDPPVA
ncbi:MAG TPA: cadherin-like domain-containing protein, partial [Thermoanaerobaculia bacterium]|nr:cadherin-like domain-containing protein [Thermoanaerobaculia bacterium]